eukprot:333057_1
MAANDGWSTLCRACPVCKQGNYYWKHPGGDKAEAQTNCPEKGYIVQINSSNKEIRCDGCKGPSTYQGWKWKCAKHDFAQMGDWHIHPLKCAACARAFGNSIQPFYKFTGLKKNCTVCNKTAPKKHDNGKCAGVMKLVEQVKMQMFSKRNKNNNNNNKQSKNNNNNNKQSKNNNNNNKQSKNNSDTQKRSEERYPKAKYNPEKPPDLNIDHVEKFELPEAKIEIPKNSNIDSEAFTKHFGKIDVRELPKEPPRQYVGLPASELIRQRPLQPLKNPYAPRRQITVKKIKPKPKQFDKMMNKIKKINIIKSLPKPKQDEKDEKESLISPNPMNNIPVERLKKEFMPLLIERLKNLDLAMSMDEHNEVFDFIKKIENHNQLNNSLKLELKKYADVFKQKYPNIHSLPKVNWQEAKVNEIPKELLRKDADTRFINVADKYSELLTNDVRNINNGKFLAWKLYKRNKCSKIISPKELGYTEVSPENEKYKKAYKHTLQAKAKSGEITINAINMGQGSFSTRLILTNNTNKFQVVFVPPGTQFAQKDFSGGKKRKKRTQRQNDERLAQRQNDERMLAQRQNAILEEVERLNGVFLR